MQDAWRWGRTAKPRLHKTLGPEPSCCWQDRGRGASGPWLAGEYGSARPGLGALRGTASSSRDSRTSTSASCHCRLDDRPNLRQPFGDDTLDVSAAGTRQPRKRSVPDEIGKGGRNMGKTGTIAEHSSRMPSFCFNQKYCRNDLETAVEWYRVLANWGAFPPDPPRRACRPPHPPCQNPTTGCTVKPTGAVPFLGGADTTSG